VIIDCPEAITFTDCPTCDKVLLHCINQRYLLSNDLYYFKDDPELEEIVVIMKEKIKVYSEVVDIISH